MTEKHIPRESTARSDLQQKKNRPRVDRTYHGMAQYLKKFQP